MHSGMHSGVAMIEIVSLFYLLFLCDHVENTHGHICILCRVNP